MKCARLLCVSTSHLFAPVGFTFQALSSPQRHQKFPLESELVVRALTRSVGGLSMAAPTAWGSQGYDTKYDTSDPSERGLGTRLPLSRSYKCG
jgi:hypothetical protein